MIVYSFFTLPHTQFLWLFFLNLNLVQEQCGEYQSRIRAFVFVVYFYNIITVGFKLPWYTNHWSHRYVLTLVWCGSFSLEIAKLWVHSFILQVLVSAHVFVDMKFLRDRGLTFISTKARVFPTLCHMCIQASHIEPCCDKCDMPHITVKSRPLIGQKWTTVV